MITMPKVDQRVRHIGEPIFTGVEDGLIGTITNVDHVRRGINHLITVKWDNGNSNDVFAEEVDRVFTP